MRMLALLSMLGVASAASANVLWKGDWETGDLSQWDRIDGLTSMLTVQQSVVHQGKYALRVELHQGQISSSGNRNELELAGHLETEGTDKWYAWSTLFPNDYPSNDTWQVFTQFHHTGCCGSPPVEFDVFGERIQLAHDGDTVLWTAPLVRGVWHDFVVHVYWSSTNGYVELWYDGQQVLGKTSVQTLYPGQQAYLKQGLYWDRAITSVGVLYHDGMVMGTSLADVAPQLVTPPPAPPPAPVPDAGTPDVPAVADPAADAGVTSISAANVTGSSEGGCSQTSPGSLAALGLVALGMFALRRRR